MIRRNIKYIVGFCIGFVFSVCLFLGLSPIIKTLFVNESKVDIYLNGALQTFRSVDGVRLSVIEYDGIQYIPLGSLGGFLGYDVTENSENIFLNDSEINFVSNITDVSTDFITDDGLEKNSNFEKIEDIDDAIYKKDKYSENIFVNISSNDLDGVLYSNDDIYMNDYTLFLVWTYWCKDCENVLAALSEKETYLNENNIEIVGLPIYSSEEKLDEIVKKMKEYNLSFRNLQKNPYIESFFFNNLSNIPAIYIVDSKGRLRLENKSMFIKIDDILDEILSLSNCSEC